jgi:hypothetical protein
MEDRAPSSSAAVPNPSVSQSSTSRHFAGRGAWVLTAYGFSGLALFGVLAYFFSEYIAR